MKLLKRFFKWIFILIVLCISAYGIFRGVEYFKGSDYIAYLEANQESVGLDEPFTFEICRKDIEEKSLILVGEIHGFEEPTKFDVDFFQYLRTDFNVETYLMEMDHSQAYFMNKYNQTGDQDLLKRILQNWVVNAGKNNQDYLDRWINLQQVYKDHPFQYYGINNISDVDLLVDHLNDLTGEELVMPQESKSDSLVLVEVKAVLESLSQSKDSATYSPEVTWDIQYLLKNVNYWLEDTYREEILTDNLQDVYERFQLKEEKVYGSFGLGHTLTGPFESGYQPMAYRVIQADPWFEDKILSMNFVFCDSHTVMPSKSLPGILQDDGKYTRVPVSYDNIWLSYLYGIEDLKRVTDKESKTIFKLNAEDSPYKSSDRLFRMFKILPVGQVINAGKGFNTTDLAQYLIFVRNSDWAEPIQDTDG
ncbi:hypothetical protein ACT6NV_03375 [Robiginitalea sp. IMCC44478]|uniref:hypothetical protein n=1 Tax=Robiginitalea sp. IMCC44478 TaxID=3459122 RepID=UPI0040420DDD